MVYDLPVDDKTSVCSGFSAILNAQSVCNKVDELQIFLYDQNVDVCCVTET